MTIQTQGRKTLFGWATTHNAWSNTERDSGLREINICAEHLHRPINEIMGTLIHEMVHIHQGQNGIKGCSSNQYHNKKFKVGCEEMGLDVTRGQHGWA